LNIDRRACALAAGLATMLAACARSTAPLELPSAAAERAVAPALQASGSSHHLYVADPGTGAIYRYPLVEGLPSTSPDETFALVPNVSRLGVDGEHNIYAAGSSRAGGFVQKYSAAGELLGSIQLDVTIGSFAVDHDGYFYVAPNAYGNVAFTYSPQAFESTGGAQPIATLTASGGSSGLNAFISMAANSDGRLYAATYYGINVFDDPHQSSQQSATITAPQGKWEPVFNGAIGFDEVGRLYADLGYQDYCLKVCTGQYWRDTDFDWVEDGLTSKRKDNLILAGDCAFKDSAYELPGTVTGLAVYDGYVEAACYGDKTSVWVYKEDTFGRQHALETLGHATRPTDAKIGP
jgi:hypothetical protein